MQFLEQLDSFLWGWFLILILLGTGLFLTCRLGFVQFRYFGAIFGNIKRSMKKKEGGVSGFGALCSAMGSQIGTGNLVGVASALVSGGPGAVFWMWMTALVGMSTNFSEVVLSLLYRETRKDGSHTGSPCYYMTKGLKNKGLAMTYAVFVILGIGIVYAMLQANSVVAAVKGLAPGIPLLVSGVVLMILTALVIFGGMKRLAEFSSIVVPFMSLAYLLIALIVIIANIGRLPEIFVLIFRSAFSLQAIGGGMLGHTMRQAIRYGTARGLFSNDAGNGTAASLHSAADVRHPFTQGLSGMLSVFMDTIVVCSCTAFIILVTGSLDSGKEGIELTQYALGTVMGQPGYVMIMIAMFLFGFTSLLADLQIGEVNIEWAFGRKEKLILFYRILGCVLVVIGSVVPTSFLWILVDIMTAGMAVTNVIPLILLSGQTKGVIRDYQKKVAAGEEDPEFDFGQDYSKMQHR